MSFLLPFLGAVVGAVSGFFIGEMLHVGYGGTAFDARYLLAMIGVVGGYFCGRIFAGKTPPKKA